MAMTARYASSAGAGSHDGTSPGDAWSFAEMLANAVAGQVVNFQGDHTLTASASLSNAGTAASPIKIRGYATTPGDAYQGRVNVTGPLVTTKMPVLDCGAYTLFGTNRAMVILEGFQIAGAVNASLVTGGTDNKFVRCALINNHTGAAALSLYLLGARSLAWDCDISFGGAAGVAALKMGNAVSRVIDCRLSGGAVPALDVATGGPVAIDCTFVPGTNDLVFLSATGASLLCHGCKIAGGPGGSDGLATIDGVTGSSELINCVITDHAGYGLNIYDNDIAMFLAGCQFARNTSGDTTGAANWIEATTYSEAVRGARGRLFASPLIAGRRCGL